MARRASVALALLGAAATVLAGPPPDRARGEIAALVEALGRSGCQFERNGRWHDAEAARTHLERKYAAALERGAPVSTEAFIDRVAARSSISGREYRVRCPGAAVTTSRAWLGAERVRLRAGAARAATD